MDFDRWLRCLGCESKEPEDDLPEGLYGIDGKLMARCRCCDDLYLHEGKQDGSDFDQGMSYCNKNQYCTP